jgi:hypothetical protein
VVYCGFTAEQSRVCWEVCGAEMEWVGVRCGLLWVYRAEMGLASEDEDPSLWV